MKQKRNGLLEIYRLIICFWPLYFHDFFFWKRNLDVFSGEILSVSYFFMLSGFFLMRTMRKEKDTPIFKGVVNIMLGRVKPLAFTMGFIFAFDLLYLIFFVKENHFYELYLLVRYWWFILFLTVGLGLLYLAYRLIKNEKIYAIFLAILVLTFAVLHYIKFEMDMASSPLSYVARTLGGISLGVLISYIPEWKPKKFNVNIIFVALLIPVMLYIAYIEKNFFMLALMIVLFGALMYFSSNINVGGSFFDLIGQLSVRMYLYMAFITVFECLGLTNHRVLFVINLFAATMDLVASHYMAKYKALKKKTA